MKKKRTIAIGIVLFLVWMVWGNLSIAETHFTLSDEKVPEAFAGFKIAHLSDIHDRNINKALRQPLEDVKPDIIVITGDLIDSREPDIEQAVALVESLQEFAPVYFVTGNHEAWSGKYKSLEEGLLEAGVTILANDSIELERDTEMIRLLGVEDPSFKIGSNLLNEEAAVVETTIRDLSDGADTFSILLSHRPELFDMYRQNNIDLVLSGHAHGGQFRLPLIGGLIAPDQGLFPEYTAGIYEEESTRMIVSKGLGNSIIPIRFNNRAEIIFIELQSE